MISSYYQQELSHLKELAVEFAQAHPALAPLLSGPSSDPDVERILEGVAFLTGLVREKLDDEFPEIVHNLLQIILPHYLRPVPSTVIMRFTPKPGLMEVLPVKAGTRVASVPVNDTQCYFTTSYDVDVMPLSVVSAQLESRPGFKPALRLGFELRGMRLAEWKASRLRLLLGGSYAEAAKRFHLIFRNTQRITLRSGPQGQETVLPAKNLRQVGYADDEALFPYPSNSFPGYRIIQEFFVLPHKFLFFDVTGLENFANRGEGSRFELILEMDKLPEDPPEFKAEHFILSATPAVNLFPHGAEPIVLDHRQPHYRIRPSDMRAQNYQVYAVTDVTGFTQGSVRQKKYAPFEMFHADSENEATYNISRGVSPLGETIEQYLSVAYRPGEEVVPETLSVNLLCTNFRLPESLQLGDVRMPTESSPELCEFTNISRPTATIQPPIGKTLLWRLLSHMALNYMSLADAKSLKALLRLYIFPDSRDQASIVANNKRVDGIRDFTARVTDRLAAGSVVRGHELKLTIDSQNFASVGDMYVFASILDFFLASYAGVNCYSHCHVTDFNTGEKYVWPIRVGERRLL